MWHGRRMKASKHELKQGRFKLDIKRKFFTVRTIKQRGCATSILGSFQH